MSGRIQYIKIARIDKNGIDNTTALETLSTLVLPSGSSFTEYKILSKTRYQNYFLYYVQPPDRNNIPNEITSSLNYDLTGSLGGTTLFDLGVGGVAFPIPTTTATGSSSSFLYNSSQQKIQLLTYPQKDLHLKTNSFFVTSSDNGVFVELYRADSVLSPSSIVRLTNNTQINAGGFKGPFTREATITGSLTGDVFFLGATANSFPMSGGPFIKVGVVDGSKLEPMDLFVTSSAATGDALRTIIEPNFTSKFFNEDCDVLQNNATRGIPNNLLQKVDYSTDAMNPVNFEALISGTAENVDIPQSHFEISSILNPTYNKSIVQSDDVNLFRYYRIPKLTDFGDPINVGNVGQTPSVSSLDTLIYEFEWGGGTTPLILGCGAVKLGKILEVSSKDQVKTISPSDNITSVITPINLSQASASVYGRDLFVTQSRGDYVQILNGNNPVNTRINMSLYPYNDANSNPTLPSTTQILTSQYGVPTQPTFMGTSSYFGGYGGYTPPLTNWIRFKTSSFISRANSDYTTGEPVSLVTNSNISGSATSSNNFVNTILNSMNNENARWFITVYNELENGFSNSELTPTNTGRTATDVNNNFIDPLGQRGVSEILGIDTSSVAGEVRLHINDPLKWDRVIFFGGSGAPFPHSGFFIWKARAAGKGEFVIVQDEVTGGVQAGAFTSAFTPDYITENFEEITKEYGANQTG